MRWQLARRKNVEERKMFGGVGFLLNGNMLVGVWKDSLIARLGPDEGDEALKEQALKRKRRRYSFSLTLSNSSGDHAVERPAIFPRMALTWSGVTCDALLPHSWLPRM